MAKISIVLPIYNVENYLDTCLDSILNQTFEDFEVICINDGSTDNSVKIAEQYTKFDNRIKLYHQENKGLSVARNKGMQYVTSEYTMFVDSDDFISQIMLEKMHQNIVQNNSDFVFCNVHCSNIQTGEEYIWDRITEKDFKKMVKTKVFSEQDVPPEFMFKMHTMAWGKLYRTDFIKNFKFPEGLIFEDVPYFAECFLNAKKISYILEPFYTYRQLKKGTIIVDADVRYLDIFKINDITTEIFKKYNKFEKYKNALIVNQMKDSYTRLSMTKDNVHKKMYEKFKQHFKNIDFNQYDKNEINTDNIYVLCKEILKTNYSEYKILESRLKNG